MFDDRYVADNGRALYDVSPDGRRFLMIKNEAADTQTNVPTDIILVENWFEELKRLVPTRLMSRSSLVPASGSRGAEA